MPGIAATKAKLMGLNQSSGDFFKEIPKLQTSDYMMQLSYAYTIITFKLCYEVWTEVSRVEN